MQGLLFALLIVSIVLFVVAVVFLVSVPHHLADIAFYLQKIVEKNDFFDENT